MRKKPGGLAAYGTLRVASLYNSLLYEKQESEYELGKSPEARLHRGHFV